MKTYGDNDLVSEKMAHDKQVCRKIVDEINDYGVNDSQRMSIIYMLALELENLECMRNITSEIREFNDSFISGDQKKLD